MNIFDEEVRGGDKIGSRTDGSALRVIPYALDYMREDAGHEFLIRAITPKSPIARSFTGRSAGRG